MTQLEDPCIILALCARQINSSISSVRERKKKKNQELRLKGDVTSKAQKGDPQTKPTTGFHEQSEFVSPHFSVLMCLHWRSRRPVNSLRAAPGQSSKYQLLKVLLEKWPHYKSVQPWFKVVSLVVLILTRPPSQRLPVALGGAMLLCLAKQQQQRGVKTNEKFHFDEKYKRASQHLMNQVSRWRKTSSWWTRPSAVWKARRR